MRCPRISPGADWFSGLNLGNVEHDHVLVEVVEVAGVALVPVVGELRRLIPVGIDAGVVAVDAKGIAVKDGAHDTGGVHVVTLARHELDGAGVGEGEVGARALPEGDGLGVGELGVLIMERVGLEEDVGGGPELGEHDDVLEIFRGKPLHAADVEQGAHASETVDAEGHLICGVPDEVRIEDSLSRRETLAVLSVETVQKVNAPSVAGPGVGAAGVHVVEGLAHHVVDGTHDKIVEGDGHALLNLIEKHREKAIELGGGGEGLIQGLLLNGTLDLERGHLVEELDVHVGLVEHVRIVGSAVGEIPTLILSGGGEPGADLLQNRAITPIVHEDRRRATGIGAVDEDHLTDVVDQGADEAVEGIGIEDRIASIDDALKVFRDEVVLTEGLGEGVVDDLINLFYFH